MIVVRRDALKMLAGATTAAAFSARTLAVPVNGAPSVTKQLPSFELQGTAASLASLGVGIAAYSLVLAGPSTFAVWLKGKDGSVSYMGVQQQEPFPMFEVFTVAIATLEELESRWRGWKPPPLPDNMPEPFRTFVMTRPAAPTAPANFEPWPFDRWQTHVLRRAEFIVEGASPSGTVGSNPNMQAAALPMSVPPEASASCEVAAGILFTGANGRRLLMGVDWMPENMVVTEEPAIIDEYLKPCAKVELTEYLERLPNHA